MILSSRIYVAIFVASGVASILLNTWLPFVMVTLGRFYGGWHHQLVGLPQHVCLANRVRDHRLNTRSIRLNPVFRFLRMNMNYHLEHHMYPVVPFYNLPMLHEAIKDQLPPQYPGLLATYRELIPALRRQARDPDDHIVRPLPTPAA